MQRGFEAYSPLTGESFASTLEVETAAPADGRPQLADVRRLARRAVRAAVRAARDDERPTPGRILRAHFPGGVEHLAVAEETWPPFEQVNVQAGLDAWLAQDGRLHEIVGLTGHDHHDSGLAVLLGDDGSMYGLPQVGNVARVNLASGPSGQTMACVQCALYLVEEPTGHRTALLLRGVSSTGMHTQVTLHVASSDPDRAVAVTAEVRSLAAAHNVFRGHVLSFGADLFGDGTSPLRFHPRPDVPAEDLVLPDGVLDAVERQVVGPGRHRDRLRAAGQQLRRGVLLYGPPGTGKTHTVRHLLGRLHGVTVVQLTGPALELIAEACSIARNLQPSLVVVEDVDLIADDRGGHPGQHPLLFQLLAEMDGLAEDADVTFLLTTNRADLLEPALAARPGRVDQAVELGLPDEDGRRALFALYSRQVDVDTSRLDDVLARTEGVTASFLKELVRRACLLAADADPDGGALAVSADTLDAALDELLQTRNAMTRVLLGATAD